MKKTLLTLILLTASMMAFADAYCGPDAEIGPTNIEGQVACHPKSRRNTPPKKVDLWGAIAVDTKGNGEAINNARTEQDARESALAGCGLPTCQVVVYVNACGATAYNENLYVAGGVGRTPKLAEKSAIEKCERDGKKPCKVLGIGRCSLY